MRMTKCKWSITFKKNLHELMLRLNNKDWTQITTTLKVFKKRAAVAGEDGHSEMGSDNKIWVWLRFTIGFCKLH